MKEHTLQGAKVHTDGKVSARFAVYSYKMAFNQNLQNILKNLKFFNFMIKSYLNMLGITPQEIWAKNFLPFKKYRPSKSKLPKNKIKNSQLQRPVFLEPLKILGPNFLRSETLHI